jgi:hypothetical protein
MELHGHRSRHEASSERAEPEWPRTKVGALARGWAEAFGKGEDAMREFLSRNLAPESLKERSLDERMASYRSLRQHFNALKLVTVVRSADGELEVQLDGGSLQPAFVFMAQTQPPYKLRSVTMRNPHAQ